MLPGDCVDRRLVDSLDDAQVPIDCLAQYAQRFLVCSAVVRRDRLRDAVELDQNGALVEAVVIHWAGVPRARTRPPAL